MPRNIILPLKNTMRKSIEVYKNFFVQPEHCMQFYISNNLGSNDEFIKLGFVTGYLHFVCMFTKNIQLFIVNVRDVFSENLTVFFQIKL